MTAQETVVTRADESDLDGISSLQAANQVDQGGSYNGAPDAYVYGLICVGKEERGKDLSQAMFAA